jgi:hypothetical protein
MTENKKLEELKDEYKVKLEKHSGHIIRHIDRYGDSPCDYLQHQRDMTNYYRGAYNSLNELERRSR